MNKNSGISVGIDAISIYTPRYFIDLKTLAKERGLDTNSYLNGIGQEKMAAPPPGEDIITMAANAANQVLSNGNETGIRNLFFATESCVDQSKAGGIYVHKLLGLHSRCRVVEVKQACYGATAALQMALPMIKQNPGDKILIVASDIARYGLCSNGEQTQGGGAVAMLITSNPRLIAFDDETGFYTEDVMDFWRPNYKDEACVDGKASIRMYIRSLLETWNQYQNATQRSVSDIDRYCYHLPFTRMAEKAHQKLLKSGKASLSDEEARAQISDSLYYNRIIGNSYAASLYIGLSCLFDKSQIDLSNKRIGLFSYGSGCTAEFFSGRVVPNYQKHIFKEYHQEMLENRSELSYKEYAEFYNFRIPTDGGDYSVPYYETGGYRLEALSGHKRIYQHRNVILN